MLTAVFPAGGVLGSLLLGYLMDKTNANVTLIISYGLSAVLLFFSGLVAQNALLFSVVIFLTGVLLVGAQVSLPALTAAFYPVRGRATGVSWMHGIGRFGAIFGAMVGAEMLRLNFSFNLILNILVVPSLVAAVALFIKSKLKIATAA
ncbi:MFS transporter [Neisseriaceae bacterium TC5R-5]|nr:MFS transporter [Neisseriaceae bacterium TC5R-5]